MACHRRLTNLARHVLTSVSQSRPAVTAVSSGSVAVDRGSVEAHRGQVDAFLAAPAGFAVVGASSSRTKFGNKILRCYLQHRRSAVPVSMKELEIEGMPCVTSLKELPGQHSDYGISVVTPPQATLEVIALAKELGIRRVWLQPGAEDAKVLEKGKELGLEMIHSGPCLLKALGFDNAWELPKVLSSGQLADGSVRWCLDDRHVMTITLANAKKRNPLSQLVLASLEKLLLRCSEGAEKEQARVVLLEAEGPVFSSGHNFVDFVQEDGDGACDTHMSKCKDVLQMCTRVNLLLQKIPQPTIAAVQGLATAAGCQLACSCDLVVAASTASFCLPGAADGGFCHTPAVSVAARTATTRQALEIALLSEKVPAAKAEQIGLVNRVVSSAELKGEVRRIAEKIAALPPQNMQQGKRTFYEQTSQRSPEEGYAVAESAMLDMFASTEYQANMKRFLAKGQKK